MGKRQKIQLQIEEIPPFHIVQSFSIFDRYMNIRLADELHLKSIRNLWFKSFLLGDHGKKTEDTFGYKINTTFEYCIIFFHFFTDTWIYALPTNFILKAYVKQQQPSIQMVFLGDHGQKTEDTFTNRRNTTFKYCTIFTVFWQIYEYKISWRTSS